MQNYTTKSFEIPNLSGISQTAIEEHLKLYAGYVKHVNLIIEKLNSLPEDETYLRSELQRRFSFEFCGMRNHELYFDSLVGSASNIPEDSLLYQDIIKSFGSIEVFWQRLKEVSLTRGIGWSVLYYDFEQSKLVLSWVDEQHLGQLFNVLPVYAIDMWEHSYVIDYLPSGKKNYVEDYIKNTNFVYVAKRYEDFIVSRKV